MILRMQHLLREAASIRKITGMGSLPACAHAGLARTDRSTSALE